MTYMHCKTSKKWVIKWTSKSIYILFLLVLIMAGMIPVPALARDRDPEITWNTFLGSAAKDSTYTDTAKVDRSGNLFVAGYGEGSWGTPINAFTGGTQDVFAAKLDQSGNLLWNTFLGGGSDDWTISITVDEDGDLFLTGNSKGAWTTSGISPYGGNAGEKDPFVAKLDGNGNLLWHTFLGTKQGSNNFSIAVDRDGNIYGAGTCDRQFGAPVIRPFQGSTDGFVVKLDPDGNILWSTFLGGPTQIDVCTSITVDPDGMILVGGGSMGTWGDPRHAHSKEGTYDGFVVRLDPDGNILQHTFMGTAVHVAIYELEVDPCGGIYVTGQCAGGWGTPIRPYSGGRDGFAAKLDRNLDTVWLTFMGSSGWDDGYGIELDANGFVYVTGGSELPWGEDPFSPYLGDGAPFIAKLDSNGKQLWHGFLGTVLGSGALVGCASLSVDGGGNVYFETSDAMTWGDPILPFSGNADASVALISDPMEEGTELHALTVEQEGQGTGRVISRPAGISCGGTCSAVFSQKTMVTLTAVPDPGFVFDGWTGVPFSGNGPSTFKMRESLTVTAVFNPDSDGDGISDEVEDGAPGGGDGNGDGLKDSEQGNVASFRDVSEEWCTMVSETSTRIRAMKVTTDASTEDDPPESTAFDAGLFSFILTDLSPGQSTILKIIMHDNTINITEYKKYGPTEEDRVPHWYEFSYDGLTGAGIDSEGDRTIISLYLKDGDRGDDDLLENGEIVDMGGPSANVESPDGGMGGSSGCFINTLTGRP